LTLETSMTAARAVGRELRLELVGTGFKEVELAQERSQQPHFEFMAAAPSLLR